MTKDELKARKKFKKMKKKASKASSSGSGGGGSLFVQSRPASANHGALFLGRRSSEKAGRPKSGGLIGGLRSILGLGSSASSKLSSLAFFYCLAPTEL